MKLDDSITRLNAAAANVTNDASAVQAALANGTVTDAQINAIDSASTQLETAHTAIAAALAAPPVS